MAPHHLRVYFLEHNPNKWDWRACLIRVLSGSKIVHVAIGDDRRVLDPSFDRDRWYGVKYFNRAYTRVAGVFEVHCLTGLPVAGRTRRFRTIPTLLNWMTRGRIPARNCLTPVLRTLRGSGHPVPRHITTPGALFRWMSSDSASFRRLS